MSDEMCKHEANGWRPIETAPKDGAKFDVWMGRDGYRICDVYWSDIQGCLSTDGVYGPEEPTPLAAYPQPTHWRPLPAAPTGRPVADPERLEAARVDGFTAGYQEALEAASDKAREIGRAISKGSLRRAGPNDQGEMTAEAILAIPHGSAP